MAEIFPNLLNTINSQLPSIQQTKDRKHEKKKHTKACHHQIAHLIMRKPQKYLEQKNTLHPNKRIMADLSLETVKTTVENLKVETQSSIPRKNIFHKQFFRLIKA